MPLSSARLAPYVLVLQRVNRGGVLLPLELPSCLLFFAPFAFEIKSLVIRLASRTVLLKSWKMVA